MKLKRLLCTITALLLLACVQVNAFAESRNIYVGDIITLEIASLKFSEEELRQKFQDFEIVGIRKESYGYLISLRTFDAGERTILLGDKEIVITVESVLEDIDRDGIFEGETEILNPGYIFHWRVVFYAAATIFVLSGAFFMIKALNKRNAKQEDGYQLFLRRSAALSGDDDNYLVKLTLYFKEYLESIHKRRIIGKTSAEIADELKETQSLNTELFDIRKWLTECDKLKFSGADVSSVEKRFHYERLLNIAVKIEKNQNYSADKEEKKQNHINEGTA